MHDSTRRAIASSLERLRNTGAAFSSSRQLALAVRGETELGLRTVERAFKERDPALDPFVRQLTQSQSSIDACASSDEHKVANHQVRRSSTLRTSDRDTSPLEPNLPTGVAGSVPEGWKSGKSKPNDFAQDCFECGARVGVGEGLVYYPKPADGWRVTCAPGVHEEIAELEALYAGTAYMGERWK